MEFTVRDDQIAFVQADIDDGAAVPHQADRIIHRRRAAGGVDHFQRQTATKLLAQRTIERLISRIQCRQTELVSDMLATEFAGIRHHHLCAAGGGNSGNTQPNRSGTHHQHLLIRHNSGTSHRVGADGKRLNQGGCFRCNLIHRQQGADRHAQVVAETAILMHANHRDPLTAVGFSALAGVAAQAGDVGHECHPLTWLKAFRATAQRHHFGTDFMAEHAWIAEERLIAGPGVDISAADPGSQDFYQCLARGRRRGVACGPDHLTWFSDDQCFHCCHGDSPVVLLAVMANPARGAAFVCGKCEARRFFWALNGF